ncbi:MAG TPA: hypothetical protein PLW48_03815 [Alphaproteobacteria bacterium]|nr:hypothetical protein [Rhodospirillaceae bacterium]HRJ66239.1 hypothetical protein [Alphaproteobacteria bacterium]
MTVTNLDENKICNITMSRIGGAQINSITDPQDDREVTCANLFFSLLDTLLAEHDWNWAMWEKTLTRDLDVDALRGFERAFRLPGDLIAGPFDVEGDGQQANKGDYVILGAHVHASYKSVKVLYRRRPPVNIWPPFFVSLFVAAFAGQLCIPERDSVSMADKFTEEAFGPPSLLRRGGLMGMAMKIDAQSKPTKTLFKNGDPFTATRY